MAKSNAMPGDPTRRLAREMRAARAYAGISRLAAARAMDLKSDEQFGRYERGEWKQAPKPLALQALARVTKIPQAYLDAGFLAPEDPATRFADAARREAEQQGEHPGSKPEDHHDEDAGDADH